LVTLIGYVGGLFDLVSRAGLTTFDAGVLKALEADYEQPESGPERPKAVSGLAAHTQFEIGKINGQPARPGRPLIME